MSTPPRSRAPRGTGLEGNGAPLVRERALARAVQSALERLYQLETQANVGEYLLAAEEGEREALLVKQASDGALELALRVPALARREFDVACDADLDPICQIIEGVSHFVYLTDRASGGRETTQLELEIQAEVDKYVVLAASLARSLDARASAKLRERLYARVAFVHDAQSESGERYRVANAFAARFTRRLEHAFVAPRRFPELRAELRRFFRLGQEDKLRLAGQVDRRAMQ